MPSGSASPEVFFASIIQLHWPWGLLQVSLKLHALVVLGALVAPALVSCSGQDGGRPVVRVLTVAVDYPHTVAADCQVEGPAEGWSRYVSRDVKWAAFDSDGAPDVIESEDGVFFRGRPVPGLDVGWIKIDADELRKSSSLTLLASLTILGRAAPWVFGDATSPEALEGEAQRLQDAGQSSPVAVNDQTLGTGSLEWEHVGGEVASVVLTRDAEDGWRARRVSVVGRNHQETEIPPSPRDVVELGEVAVAPLLVTIEAADPRCGGEGASALAECLSSASAGSTVSEWTESHPPGSMLGEMIC